MPVRSPSPKHFRWRSRTSFVEVITPSSFVGWDEQSRRTSYSATSLRRTCLDVDRTRTHSRERVADRIDLNQGWSASGLGRVKTALKEVGSESQEPRASQAVIAAIR